MYVDSNQGCWHRDVGSLGEQRLELNGQPITVITLPINLGVLNESVLAV